jgi:hypothetical protein
MISAPQAEMPLNRLFNRIFAQYFITAKFLIFENDCCLKKIHAI